MISRARAMIFFAAVFLTCSCGSQPLNYRNIRVTHVIDGDTVKLANGKLLRYIGIDTPEMRIKENGSFVYNPQPFAKEATELNKQLVEGKTIRIEFDTQRFDRYHRLLGYVYCENEFVNARMIAAGLAIMYTFPPNTRHTKEFADLQAHAQAARVGMWANDTLRISAGQAKTYMHSIKTVQGTVRRCSVSKKTIILKITENKKEIFHIVIFKNSFENFLAAGINPSEYYRGKTISITGRIRSYRGKPEMIASSPHEIEVIDKSTR